MSYFVMVTFDIKNPKNSDYDTANNILYKIGLEGTLTRTESSPTKLPNNTYAGEFEGESAGKIRQDLCTEISEEFKKSHIKASIFVLVGGDWAWGKRKT